MRQIWHDKKSFKNSITKYVEAVIVEEEDEEALICMIITLQDLHRKKLGIKESNYGDISGDVQEAKSRAIAMLNELS